MPTQSTTYNTRLTDESLEKRFRDTFRSQGGAELVDDLYASGVIVPVVDFTAAAEGSQLREDLQQAWDFTTGFTTVSGTTSTLISNSGFWQVDCVVNTFNSTGGGGFSIQITDGLANKKVFGTSIGANPNLSPAAVAENKFVVFLRPGDSLTATSPVSNTTISVWYRQIADLSGNLIQPSGFQSS